MPELLLVRHAKSDWSAGTQDHERPLNARGERDAVALGEWLRDHVEAVDRVIVSTATRTRMTWDIASSTGGCHWPVEFSDAIYEADWRDVLEVVRTSSSDQRVLVVGHNPGLEELATALDSSWSAPRIALEEKFPTSAVARLRFTGEWSDLAVDRAELIDFVVARG